MDAEDKEDASIAEVRVDRMKVVAEDIARFAEKSASPLSDRDRDHFLELLANPPAPTPALKKAAARHKARHG